MAERRMFARTIIDSDAFLDLPISAQALYFHLAMRADDDGFVNKPRAIMNMIGAKNDDMRLLINKKFVIFFDDSGVVVIKHWRIHNYIQKDRYKETKYKFEKAKLFLDENNSYSLTPQGELVSKMDTECIHDVSNSETQVRDRLEIGKDSIGKDNTLSAVAESDGYSDEFNQFWSAYPKKVGKKEACKAFKKVKEPLSVLLDAIKEQKLSEQWTKENGRFIPNPATWLNQGRWEDHLERKEVLPF